MRLNLNQQTGRLVRQQGRFFPQFFLSALLPFLLLVNLTTPQVFAQPKASEPPPISNRFLFIVDTSSAMKGLQQDELKVVYELLANSATGQMHSGDSVGLWTFNQNVYSDLPAQTWKAENHEQVMQRTLNFLQQQRYARASRLEKALADMRDVIQASDIITVFIISSGHGKISGTPFDKEINTLYRQALADMKHNPKPVITVLQARDGKIVRFTVNALPWPVVVPEIPIPIRAAQAVPSQTTPEATVQQAPVANGSPAANTSHHPVVTARVPPPVTQNPDQSPQLPPPNPTPSPTPAAPAPPAAPASANTTPLPSAIPPPVLRPQFSTPVIASEPTPLPESPAAQHNPPTTAPLPTPAPPNAPASNVAASPMATTQTTSIVPPMKRPMILPPPPFANNNLRSAMTRGSQQIARSNQPASSQPPPTLAAPDKPISSPAVEAPKAAVPIAQSKPATQPAPRAPETNSLASRAYAFVSPEVAGRPKSLLFAGLALLLLAIVLIVVMVRRSRKTSGPSLISQTMGNSGKK